MRFPTSLVFSLMLVGCGSTIQSRVLPLPEADRAAIKSDDLGLFSYLTYNQWYAKLDNICQRPGSFSAEKFARLYTQRIDQVLAYLMAKYDRADVARASLRPETYGCGLPADQLGAIPRVEAALTEFERRRTLTP